MLTFLTWHQIFYCFGVLGLVWVAVWHTWFRDDPSQHRGVNAAELQTIVDPAKPVFADAVTGLPAAV